MIRQETVYFDALDGSAHIENDSESADESPPSPLPHSPIRNSIDEFADIDVRPRAVSSFEVLARANSFDFKPERIHNVKRKDKQFYEFDALSLSQTIAVEKQIWTLKFSHDGSFLAGGGEQGLLVVWECLTQSLSELLTLKQKLDFHSNTVIDLSWSTHVNHLLSAGMDKSAVLWDMDDLDHLAVFPHPDIVSCVSFYPHSPNYFITGSFDRIIRLWNVANKRVEAYWQVVDIITAGCFSPTHNLLLIGMLHGQVNIYRSEIPELKLVATLECRNRRGMKRKGRKVTGLEFYDDSHFLVTTNDSRLRLYSLKDLTMTQKYKGLANESLPIKATFSHNWQHLVCGSDSSHVFIWNVFSDYQPVIGGKLGRNQSYECFLPSVSGSVTATAFAPNKLLRRVQERALRHNFAVGHVLVVADYPSLRVYLNAYVTSEA
mmetsp:Transcript_6745/g.12037  ORF Transcript_6745/g.12037 Transcript_6745/m.12037 type:complete len:433 (+) Transcript_6745:1104-2402(+)